MFTYYTLGNTKRLCDIVVSGSHDAGITSGDDNVQMQNLDIFAQAQAGVRVFDLRIAAMKESSISAAPVLFKAFHADPLLMHNKEKKNKQVFDLNAGKFDVTTTKLPAGGAFGMRLPKILSDAKDFVKYNSSEFLILKFDKSTNWSLVARVCVQELGNAIYTGVGSLNEKTLDDLKGKVVVVFTPKGIAEVSAQGYGAHNGILGCRSLTKGGGYNPGYDGLQYIGKGGTSPLDGDSDIGKIASNYEKQSGLMRLGAAHTDPEVMGMMYWTTTGLNRSILERNNVMWAAEQRPMLTRLWMDGFQESIEMRLARHVDPTQYANGALLKAFMPNIVMVDFADLDKCKFIYDLNTTAATMLTDTARKIQEMQAAVGGGRGGRRVRGALQF
jgi:hypothetical protein